MYIFNELDENFLADCSLCRKDGFPATEMLNGVKGMAFEKKTVSVALVFVLKGKVEITSGFAVNRLVAANRFFLLPPEVDFTIRYSEDSELMIFNLMDEILFCERYRSGSFHEIYKDNPVEYSDCDIFSIEMNEKISQLIDDVLFLLKKDFYCPYYIKCKSTELLILIGLYYPKEALAKLYQPILKGNSIFKSLMMQYRNKIFTVKEFADIVHLNRDTFRRRFKEVFGIGPSKWIQKQRIDMILEELNKDQPIIAVMDKCGFSFHSDFTRFCKKHLDLTPVMIKKKIKMQKSN
jgi:AraC-like DNA-binding protein